MWFRAGEKRPAAATATTRVRVSACAFELGCYIREGVPLIDVYQRPVYARRLSASVSVYVCALSTSTITNRGDHVADLGVGGVGKGYGAGHSTAQHGTARHNTAQHSTHSTSQPNRAQHSTTHRTTKNTMALVHTWRRWRVHLCPLPHATVTCHYKCQLLYTWRGDVDRRLSAPRICATSIRR